MIAIAVTQFHNLSEVKDNARYQSLEISLGKKSPINILYQENMQLYTL